MTEENDDLADEKQIPWGHSGTSFDQKKLFTFEDAARALVFDLCGRYVPSLPTKLTPEGQAYHDWIDTLHEASSADSGALQVSIYLEDKKKQMFIQRRHLREWCEGRQMRPKFLFQPLECGGLPLIEAAIFKQSIHQIAELKANESVKEYADKVRANRAHGAVYKNEVSRIAQEIDSGVRSVWAGAGAREPRAGDKHPLIVQMRDWLKQGRTTENRTITSEGFVHGTRTIAPLPKVTNENWIRGLYVADKAASDSAPLSKDSADRIVALETEVTRLKSEATEHDNGWQVEGKIPTELDAAMIVYRAVANRKTTLPDTIKNTLLVEVETTYPEISSAAKDRIATVANWEKSAGRKK